MRSKKGDISTTTIILVALGLLVLIVLAVLLANTFGDANKKSKNTCTLLEGQDCYTDGCGEKDIGVGFCPLQNSKVQFCCKK